MIMGILFCIGFSIIDFPMAIGLGVMIGIMDLVPYLHGFGLIPAALLAGLKSAETGQSYFVVFGMVLAIFGIVQIIMDAIVVPKVMGKHMGLNPTILLLSLSVWGTLLGFIGLIIALPATTLIIAYWRRYVTKDSEEVTGERLEVKGESVPLSEVSHPELQGSAMQVEPFRSIINPDDKAFANPPSMIEAIQQYCRETGQQVPETPAELCRCIFDSLALRYRQVFQWLKEFSNFDLQILHIIGGGSLNKYLNQFTADACGVEVLAGPQECTAIGNIMLQAKAAGVVGDIWQMRRIIADSVEMVPYHPAGDKAAWDQAYKRYLEIAK
jgi:sugar (pentulose or hexulose) kinase